MDSGATKSLLACLFGEVSVSVLPVSAVVLCCLVPKFLMSFPFFWELSESGWEDGAPFCGGNAAKGGFGAAAVSSGEETVADRTAKSLLRKWS